MEVRNPLFDNAEGDGPQVEELKRGEIRTTTTTALTRRTAAGRNV